MKPLLIFIFAIAPFSLFGQSLNLSRDLLAKGIATSNMTPDQPALDSRPLLEAAITYSQKNKIAVLVADPGAYYFLSLHNNMTHVLLNAVTNLTLDFQNSDLYFKTPNRSAILCTACTNVTLQNFTVDFQSLPFTQVTVTAVNSANRSITFAPIAGFRPPSDFNGGLVLAGGDSFVGFVFRNGVPIAETGRMSVNTPVTGNTIVFQAGTPWSLPAAVAGIKPGDVFVYTDRGGPHAMHFDTAVNCAVHNVSIYSSGSMGLTFPGAVNMEVDHVQIIPRPGTSRLISTNADGIHGTFAGPNNVINDNIVRRTCDDSLAYDAPWTATISAKPNGATVMVQRYATLEIPIGASLTFINPDTEAVIGSAKVVSESPTVANQTFAAGETLSLTLDQTIAGLAVGSGVVDNNPAQHGDGSVMTNNLVQEGVFSRGIWLSGVTNINVHDNFVQRTSKTGIFIQQLNGGGALNGASSNITIRNNLVDNAISYGGPSIGPIVTAASIHTVSENAAADQVPGNQHSNIVVTGNRVTNSPRTAIRLENVNGGDMSNNMIQGYGLNPSLNLYLVPDCCETMAQYLADFSMPMLTTNVSGVTSTGNAITADLSNLISISSTASGSPKVAAGSIVAAYGSRLDGTSAVSVTDSRGQVFPAKIIVVTPNQVNLFIPAGAAQGIATVTIDAQSGGVLIDSVAPGLYSANSTGSGVAAAGAALYSADGKSITPQNVAACTTTCIASPLDLGGPTDTLIVTLYGTGLRGLSGLPGVMARIDGAMAQVLYAGSQGQFEGLDQVNLSVPRSLAGAGEVPVVLTIDGQTANVVTIAIK